jgi:hypothetical protein
MPRRIFGIHAWSSFITTIMDSASLVKYILAMQASYITIPSIQTPSFEDFVQGQVKLLVELT